MSISAFMQKSPLVDIYFYLERRVLKASFFDEDTGLFAKPSDYFQALDILEQSQKERKQLDPEMISKEIADLKKKLIYLERVHWISMHFFLWVQYKWKNVNRKNINNLLTYFFIYVKVKKQFIFLTTPRAMKLKEKFEQQFIDIINVEKIQDVIDFVINVFAVYGLLILVFKYFQLPNPITFDMVAIAFLIVKCIKIIIFTRK